MSIDKSQLGVGGTGMHGRGAGTAAAILLAVASLQHKLVAGGAANAVLPLDVDSNDKIISVFNIAEGVPADVTATTSIVDTRAKGTVTLSTAGTATDTVTIAGLKYTLVAATTVLPAHENARVRMGANATATAANLVAAINAREGNRSAKVIATSAAGVVTITAVQPGTAGNALTLVETGNSMTISGATLTGGTATTGIRVTTATTLVQVLYYKNA